MSNEAPERENPTAETLPPHPRRHRLSPPSLQYDASADRAEPTNHIWAIKPAASFNLPRLKLPRFSIPIVHTYYSPPSIALLFSTPEKKESLRFGTHSQPPVICFYGILYPAHPASRNASGACFNTQGHLPSPKTTLQFLWYDLFPPKNRLQRKQQTPASEQPNALAHLRALLEKSILTQTLKFISKNLS